MGTCWLNLRSASHNFRQCLTFLRTHVFMTTQSDLTMFHILIIDECVKRTSHRAHHPCTHLLRPELFRTLIHCRRSGTACTRPQFSRLKLPSPELPYLQKMRGCILYQPSSSINVVPKYSISHDRIRFMSNGFTDFGSIRIRSRSTSWILG